MEFTDGMNSILLKFTTFFNYFLCSLRSISLTLHLNMSWSSTSWSVLFSRLTRTLWTSSVPDAWTSLSYSATPSQLSYATAVPPFCASLLADVLVSPRDHPSEERLTKHSCVFFSLSNIKVHNQLARDEILFRVHCIKTSDVKMFPIWQWTPAKLKKKAPSVTFLEYLELSFKVVSSNLQTTIPPTLFLKGM